MRSGSCLGAGRAAGLAAAFLLIAGRPVWSQAPGRASPCREIHTITTPQELDTIRNNLAGCYRLGADIDLAGIAFAPIGSESEPFTGVFDGDGHVIENFAYDGLMQPPYSFVGLFGVASGATIKNVELRNVAVNGLYKIGGLVGLLHEGARVTDCHVEGCVQGYEDVGGVVGRTHFGAVEQSSADVSVFSWVKWAGGLVGHCHPGSSVRHSEAHVSIVGGTAVGGLVGNHHGSVIEHCHVTGNVSGGSWTGGLVGYCQRDLLTGDDRPTVVIHSSADVEVQLGASVLPPPCAQGLGLTAPTVQPSELLASADPGAVAVSLAAPGNGGLIGYMETNSVVMHSSASGSVQSPDEGVVPTGGLVGFVERGVTVRDSFAQGNVTGTHPIGGLVGWSDSDIVDCHASGNVTGTWSVAGLVAHAGSSNPIVISHSHASGHVMATGAPNSHAEPGHLLAAAGGLVGYVFPGTAIEYSYATGSVTAEAEQVGGLVGFFWGGKITRCYATGDVVGGDKKIGGLVGLVRFTDRVGESTIVDCYALGSVTSTGLQLDYRGQAGGLIGASRRTRDSTFDSRTVTQRVS
ncbi:MAG: GLUG motif-containing protein [Planctomycetota bacterium]